jgi:uncharacterized coiled-coil protein SlyX
MYSEDLTEPSLDGNKTMQSVDISKHGMLTEVTIDGKTIDVVDPALVYKLQQSIAQLQKALKAMDQKIRNLQTKTGQIEGSIQKIKTELKD